jgi:NADH-quinone oxidoreductase subunit N
MLLSLASIPLTAGFIGEFYLVAAGASGSLWALVIILVVSSAIGLFYYLRIVLALYSHMPESAGEAVAPSRASSHSLCWTLGVLTVGVFVFGCFPLAVLRVIQTIVAGS